MPIVHYSGVRTGRQDGRVGIRLTGAAEERPGSAEQDGG